MLQSLYALKITISNYCDFKCEYCYVDTDNHDVISEKLLYQSIDYYLSQKWRQKTIFFLGGEALLQFDVLKKGIKRVRDFHAQDEVNLFITTSWMSLTKEKVDFLYSYGVKVGISIDGDSHTHWINRKTRSGKNTYLLTQGAIKVLNSQYDDSNSGYAMTVDENTVEKTFSSFIFLSHLDDKHRNITIAWVYKNSWNTRNITILEKEIEKICKYIYLNIIQGKYYYYNVLSFFILQVLSWYHLEEGNIEMHVFPNGQVSKYLFAQSVLGNTWDDPTQGRFDFVNAYAKKILKRAKTDDKFRAYIWTLSCKPIL